MIFLKSKSKKEGGFTLIELLVVIAIVGVLSSVVLAAMTQAKLRTKYVKSQAEINQFLKVAVVAQGESGRTLLGITANGCTDCACRGIDIRNISITHACYISWLSALTAIQNSTNGTLSGITNMTRDPWGSPYGLDENEGESGGCLYDTIRSAGPNGILYDSDDQGYTVPHISSACP